jgi:acyl carrier protein
MSDTGLEGRLCGLVRDAIAAIQRQCGREVPEIDDSLVPLQDLGAFDSLNATEACVLLSAEIGVKVEPNVFATSRGRPLPIGDIARGIITRYGTKMKLSVGGGAT